MNPDDGPDPDHVPASDLDGDEGRCEDVRVVLLERGLRHLGQKFSALALVVGIPQHTRPNEDSSFLRFFLELE